MYYTTQLKIFKETTKIYCGNTNKFPPFCDCHKKLSIYCERTIHNVLFKIMAIASHYFFPSFW